MEDSKEWGWTASDLVANIVKSADNETFHNDSFMEGLSIFSRCANSAVGLSSEAGNQLKNIASRALKSRLDVDVFHRRHPGLAEKSINGPVFVVGLPRTGTTLTNNLLSLNPRRRTLLNWETEDSTPPANLLTLRTDPRCLTKLRFQEAQFRRFRRMAQIHWEWADSPGECGAVLAQDFKSPDLALALSNPDYTRFFMEGDLSSAYNHHKRLLQVLEIEEGQTWNLKAPGHALHVDALLRTYPDARLIWLHRDPFQAVASACSFAYHYLATLGHTPNLREIGRYTPAVLGQYPERYFAAKQKYGSSTIYDLSYSKLVSSPIREMEILHGWLDEPLDPEVIQVMKQWLIKNPQGKYGKHNYNLEMFGLTRLALDPYFLEYDQRVVQGGFA